MLGPVFVMQNLINCLSGFDGLLIKLFYLDKKVDQNIRFAVPANRLIQRNFCFEEYDIIHTNGIRPDLFAYLNRGKIRYHISTIHNFVFEDLISTYNNLVSLLFGNIWVLLWRRADKLVCVSEMMKIYYSKWFSSSKLETIHNGVPETDNYLGPDKQVVVAIEDFHSSGFEVIGCVCIMTKRKGMDKILNFISTEPKFAFVLIGDGKELLNLKRMAEKLRISDRCLFCGFKSNAVVYFKLFDFFITPSRSEGFGLALVEAVQQKVPVICSNIEVFKELFNEEEVTFFKLDDINSLSESLKLSAKNGKLKAELAFTRYIKNYTAEIMARSYYNLYQSASLKISTNQ
jgi:L-malate glycosyltransferase